MPITATDRTPSHPTTGNAESQGLLWDSAYGHRPTVWLKATKLDM